jgi:antitoxin CptB
MEKVSKSNTEGAFEKKLFWACRRGMLELDVLLGNFLREAYPTLAAKDQQAFAILLTYSDPELFSWLLGHEAPPEPTILTIVNKVRDHARARHLT